MFLVIFEFSTHLVSARAVHAKVAASTLPNILQRLSLMALACCATIVLWGCGFGGSIYLAESLVASPGTVLAATGAVTGQMAVNSNSSGGAPVVSLSETGIATAVRRLSIRSAILSFGNVTVGSPATQPFMLTSTGDSPVTVSSVAIKGAGLTVSGVSLPVVLKPNQSMTLQVQFNPAAAGAVTGQLVINSDSSSGAVVVSLNGTGIAKAVPRLSVSTASLNFGNVTVGSPATQPLTLTSTGGSPVTVTAATIRGTGFRVLNLSLPVTLSPGQSITLQIRFSPTTTGGVPGDLVIGSNSSAGGSADVTLTGTGIAAASPQLTLSAMSLAFGSVTVNTPTKQAITLTSSGTSAVTISSATVAGAGFSVVPGVLPVTLNPGASATLQVQFNPTTPGAVSGELTFNSNSSSGKTTGVPLSGTGVSASSPQLTLNKASLSFSNVPVNSSATQFVVVTSKGTVPLTISAVATSGTGFSVVGSGLPMTFNNGQSLTLQVEFQPTNAGSASGTLTIKSNIAGGSTVVPLSGSAVSLNPVLTASPTTLSFGSIALNTPMTKSVTLASTGQTPVTVTSATVSGAGLTLLGGSFPLTLNVGQTTSLTLQFDPLSAGAATGQLVINSTTNGGTTAVALSGTGTAVTHAVDLSWDAPVSSPVPVTGYHVYRILGTGTPALVNSVAGTTLDFTDNTVVSGTTYSYFVKSVGAAGVESVASNETQATIP